MVVCTCCALTILAAPDIYMYSTVDRTQSRNMKMILEISKEDNRTVSLELFLQLFYFRLQTLLCYSLQLHSNRSGVMTPTFTGLTCLTRLGLQT